MASAQKSPHGPLGLEDEVYRPNTLGPKYNPIAITKQYGPLKMSKLALC